MDVGAGDGRFVLRTARARPDSLVVGLDPAWRGLVPAAVRAQRKPARGGAPNALFVSAAIEDPPEPLRGIADEVCVQLPWGTLLTGLVTGEPGVCRGLRAIARPGASLRVVIGADIWREPVPSRIRGLPELTADHVDSVLADRLAGHGWKVTAFGPLDAELATTWARRLASTRSAPTFVELRAEAR